MSEIGVLPPPAAKRPPVTVDARAIYERFRRYPGSEYIAKPGAIAGVSEQIARWRPSNILEVGAGIGTLTYTIIATLEANDHEARVVSIEHDPFCLAALPRNLGPSLSRVEIREDARGLEAGAFDFIIIDGGTLERGAYTELLAQRGRVLIEGFREHQRTSLRAVGRACAIREVWKGSQQDGGYWLIQFEPTGAERTAALLQQVRTAARGRVAGWRSRFTSPGKPGS